VFASSLGESVPDNRCEHEYLPDEDGTVYTCGESEGLVKTEFGWLCAQHREGSKEINDEVNG